MVGSNATADSVQFANDKLGASGKHIIEFHDWPIGKVTDSAIVFQIPSRTGAFIARPRQPIVYEIWNCCQPASHRVCRYLSVPIKIPYFYQQHDCRLRSNGTEVPGEIANPNDEIRSTHTGYRNSVPFQTASGTGRSNHGCTIVASIRANCNAWLTFNRLLDTDSSPKVFAKYCDYCIGQTSGGETWGIVWIEVVRLAEARGVR